MVKSGVTSTRFGPPTGAAAQKGEVMLRIKGLVFVAAMVMALWMAGGSPFPKCC
jgi:hypothetical protein